MLKMLVVAVVLSAVFIWLFDTAVESSSAALHGRVEELSNQIIFAWLILMAGVVLWSPFYEYLYYRAYFYDVDEQNLIIRKGVIARREITLPFAKITDVYVDQDISDVLLGLYDVHFSTPTEQSGRFAHIDGVNKYGAVRLRKMILDEINSATTAKV